MNKIIDISDNSNDSHLDLFNSQQQQQIIDSLSMKRLERTTCKTDKFDDIIEKVWWAFNAWFYTTFINFYFYQVLHNRR